MTDDRRVILTIKHAMPSVVSIMISKHLEDIEKEIPHELYSFLPGHHKAKRSKKKFSIPDFLVDEDGMVSVGGGSGFAVAPGLILTNKHVIADLKAEYTVIANDGKKYAAQILSRDPINDVAILRIPTTDIPVLKMGDAARLELGQTVIAIGNALGIFKNTVSLGIVSGLSRAISAKADPNAPSQELRGLIQTDAAVNVGNSGGPLVDLDGKAVGVNTAIVSGAQNIGFAIPINAAHRDLDDIRRYGRIRRPFLGVRYLIVDERLKKKMDLPVDYGAMVVKEGPHDHAVILDSPAEKAGIKEKDIILSINGAILTKEKTIQDFLEELNVGDTIAVELLSDGRRHKKKIRLEERINS
jgi:S1-C subfamily serine protease